MRALYPSLMLCCALGFACFGCSGRTIEGVWYGPMPGTASADCRIELRSDGVMKASCSKESSAAYIGKYDYSKEVLKLQLAQLQEERPITEGTAAASDYSVSGPGNEITLKGADGQTFIWVRKPE